MTPLEIASLLTALGAVLGVLWTMFSNRQASRENADTRMWNEAMQLLNQLQAENTRLREHDHPHDRDRHESHDSGAHADPPG